MSLVSASGPVDESSWGWQVEKSFDDYWMGSTAKGAVVIKRFPGTEDWEPRMAMCIPTELTLRDMDNNLLVKNTILRGSVNPNGGLQVQNSTVNPTEYSGSEVGFKITATEWGSGTDDDPGEEETVFYLKFVDSREGSRVIPGKESLATFKDALKKNAWDTFDQ